MKNIKILICLLSLILITGCTSKNKLVIYLENDGFDCLKNVCAKESNNKDNVKVNTIYDIDNKLFKINTEFTKYQTSTFEYNWETKKVTYEYVILDETFKTTYDYNEYEYTCESNSKDLAYKKAECDILKGDIENNIENFNNVIYESKYEIK
jgi:hypothetical protein